jgi:hypothetical protein
MLDGQKDDDRCHMNMVNMMAKAHLTYWVGWGKNVKDDASPDRVKPKTIKCVFVTSPLITQHQGERVKTVWLGIWIMGRHVYKNPTIV